MTQLPSQTPNAAQADENNDALESALESGSSQNESFQSSDSSMLDPGQRWPQDETIASGALPSDPLDSNSLQADMLQGPKVVYAGKSSDQDITQKLEKKVAQEQQWRQGKWGRLPLRSKVMLIAAVLGFLPTLTLGFINYGIQNNNLTEQLEQEALVSGEAINDQMALFMRERFGDIQIIAQSRVLSDATARAESSAQDKVKVLNQFLKAYPVYNSIAAFDLSGNPIAQSYGKAVGNHSDRSYFQAAKESGRVFISQPIFSQSTGKASIYVVSPIRDSATQEMIGIVRARIPVSYLDGLLESIAENQAKEKGAFTQFSLYNAAGELFASSQKQEGSNTTQEQKLVEDFDKGADQNLNLVRNRQVAKRLLEQQGKAFTETTAEEIIALVPFKTYSDTFRSELPPLNWKNITTIDRQSLKDKQQRLAIGLLTQALLAGGVLAIAAALLANRATRPLLAAVNAVQEIGRGKLDKRLPVKGEDELATLASNLNQMAEQLQGFNAEQNNAVLRAGWLSTIANGAEAMTDVELDESFSQVVAEARRFLKSDRVIIYRIDDNGQLSVSQEAVAGELPTAIHLDLEGIKLPEQFIETFQLGHPVTLSDTLTEPLSEEYAQLLGALQVRSEVAIPMIENQQLTGILVAQSCEPRNWQASDTTFMQQLAAQIGIAQLIQEVQTARGVAEGVAEQEKERTEELQRRVLQLLMEVDPVSQGDLTIRAKVTEDEIGTVADSYNATIESLRKIVGQVQEAVQQVSTTAITSEIAVQELSTGANQQTTEISEALAQIQQMVGSIRTVANNAVQAEAAVQQAAQTVKAGDAAMDKTVEGIFGIRETVGEAAKKVKRLGESSQKISKVVNLIGSFAEQTNLLALNASIEAAHAGEEGRGFAVVADEVRSLARQSAAATAEIEALVAEIQAETNQVSAAMEDGTEQVVAGTQLVENARQNLNQIAAVSEQISGLVEAIAQATNQQTEASELVSKVMTDVADIAEKTSGSATAVSGSFQELVNVAQSLENSVGQFKVK